MSTTTSTRSPLTGRPPAEAAIPALDVLTDAGLFDGRLIESGETARTVRRLAHRHGDLLHVAPGHSGVVLSAAYGGHAGTGAEAELAGLDERPLPPSGHGWLSYTRGELSQRRDADATFAHFADALIEARSVHNRYLEGTAIVSSCSLRARLGEPGEALDAFAQAVGHWSRLANTTQQLTTLRNLAVLFERADAPEALAELLGAVDRGEVPTYGQEAERLGDARAWAVSRLGPGEVRGVDGRGRDPRRRRCRQRRTGGHRDAVSVSPVRLMG